MAGNYFLRARKQLDAELSRSELRWKFSPSLSILRTKLVPLLQRTLAGRILDVGCGRMPFREYLDPQSILAYEGFDIEKRSPDTLFLGDAQNMEQLASESYDAVVSFYALEHMPRPCMAFREMVRVCKPGGTIVLALPHISRLHEEPHDYFRFTPYGLRAMGEELGLNVVSEHRLGGIFSFLGHQVSTVLVCAFWPIPLLKWAAFWANYTVIVRPALMLDTLLKTDSKFPVDVVAIYKKAASGEDGHHG